MANWAADFILRNNIDPARITQRAKHGIHVRKPGGEIEATFVGAPCHYQDSQGNWQAIDTALRKNTVSNRWYAPGVPVDISDSDGSVSIYGGSWAHKTSRVGIWDSKKKTFTKAWDIPELGAVDGDSFVRSGKGWEYRQRVTESGLREELTLFQKPSISLPANTWLVLETHVPGLSAVADREKAEWTADGMQFPLPRARDSRNVPIPLLPCRRWKSGDYLYTGLSAETFENATYPVIVDPDFTADNADGEVVQGGIASWATARSTSSLYVTNVDWIDAVAYPDGGLYVISRGALVYNTSTIGAGGIITQVTLTATCKKSYGTPANDILIMKYDWSASNPISDGNRETVYDGILAATQDSSILGNCSGWTANTSKTSGSLATSWVSKTANTCYGLLDKQNDLDNSAPAGVNCIDLYASEASTASYRPYLSVTHYYPHHRTLLGVGT